MGQTPEDENYDEWINSSAEEWSKPEEPVSKPDQPAEPTDRWGSPISSKEQQDDPRRWGSEPSESPARTSNTARKGGFKWWIILIIVLVILCICSCVVIGGLEFFGVLNIFN